MKPRHATTWAITILTLLAGLCLPRPAEANADRALSLVSPDAEAAIIIPDLAALNRRIGELRRTLNLSMPELDDLVGQLRRHAGMVAGFNNDGPVVLALLDVAEAIEADTPPTLALLVPVTDYDAFIGNYATADDAANPANDDTTAFHLPTGQRVFARSLGSHALLSRDRDAVQAYTERNNVIDLYNQLGPLGDYYITESSLALIVDMDALRPALLRRLDHHASDDGPYRAAARAVIEGTLSTMVAIDLDEQGLGLTQTFQFRDDASLRDYFPGQPSTTADELARLPEQPFIFAVAGDESVISFSRIARTVIDTLPAEQLANLPDPVIDSINLIERTHAYASVFYVPDRRAAASPGSTNALNIYRVDNAEQYRQQWKQNLQAFDNHQLDTNGQATTFTTRYIDNAIQIDGRRIDQYQFRMDMPPAAIGAAPLLVPQLGTTDYDGYIAVEGDHVIATTTADPQMMRTVLRAFDEQAGIGSAGDIAELRQRTLPPNLGVEAYVNIRGLTAMFNPLLTMVGRPLDDVPADLPPIAMGAGVHEGNVALRCYVPTAVMRTLGQAVQQQFNTPAPN